MRSTIKLYSALTVLAAVACQSNDTSMGGADLERAESLRSELAGSRLASSGSAIVSDLEVPGDAQLKTARQGSPDQSGSSLGSAASSGISAVANVAKGDTNNAALGSKNNSPSPDQRLESIRLNAATLSVVNPMTAVAVKPQPVVLPAPRALPPTRVSGPQDAMQSGDKDDEGTPADSVNTTAAPAEREKARRPEVQPPKVIVRGGATRPGVDPCAIHIIPIAGARGSVMVNNRLPTRAAGGIRLPR